MTGPGDVGRRRVLGAMALGVGGVAGLAGCTDAPSFPDADVIAGPGNRLVFEPADLGVAAGTTVRWGFASDGHNVSCRPEDADRIQLPDGAASFATYGPDERPLSIVPRGETYEHTFETPGEYVYVCVPHIRAGMVGTVTVE